MGCRKSWNYKHILQVSRNGEWVDGGTFPPSLGAFATIPKANVVSRLTGPSTSTPLRSTWTLRLATTSPLAVFATLSSLLITQHITTGHLVLKISLWTVPLMPFRNFVKRQVLWPNAFIVTVML
jgi:hypothetical protein